MCIRDSIRRAVIFGLGLLEETPDTRDEKWRFISVLVEHLSQAEITSVLVDWPLEGAAIERTDISRPRVSKLCANEMRTYLDKNHVACVDVFRINYSGLSKQNAITPESETKTSKPR